MDYEKKNKDAISTIKQALRQLATNGVPVSNMIEAIKDIEEKYAESEDERIKEELLNYLYDVHDDDEERARWIDWLEKQGEQKPADEVGNYDHKEVLQTVINEQKPAWSEEDEKILNYLLWFYDTRFRWNDTCCDDIKFGDIVTFLKSLKPQTTWKPSDNELEVLRLAAEKDGTCLMGLYEQLKKLREE